MSGRDSGTIHFLAGLLLGAIVGAGVSLMMDPEMSATARKKLQKVGNKLVREGSEAFEKVREETIDPTVERVSEQLKDKVNQVKKDLNGRIKRAV